MIDIVKHDTQLLLRYVGDRNDPRWVDTKLDDDGSVMLKNTFIFTSIHLVMDTDEDEFDEDARTFVLGVLDGEYYKIDRDTLSLKHDLRLAKDMPITMKTFVAEGKISIFRKIDELIDEPIVVGGNADHAIPLPDFHELLRNFPTSWELRLYAGARISQTLRDYLDTMSDAQRRLDKYLNRRKTVTASSRVAFLSEYELIKFEYIRDELLEMLDKAEAYSEKEWQRLIVGFLLLIFPKYIAVLENLHVRDYYSNLGRSTDRYIDLALVDSSGTIDIVEIKKPFSNCILSTNRYRGNYIPKTELSGCVMQAEKYLFYLSKWGIDGEGEITEKRRNELPEGFTVRITNPKAMIILGRDCYFTNDQTLDFEIMKRQYANVIDIMTYDNLLWRLDSMISMVRRHNA